MRLTHPTKKNAYEIAVDLTRKFTKTQSPCPVCNVIHTHKTYHILFNDQGVAYVSMGVFRGLRRANALDQPGGMQVESYVEKPPRVVLGTRTGKARRVPERESTIIYHTDGGK